jgi:GDP/UDP-N,N'-diacetylbacillosamine 2-epimerase (hydrolysing)
MKVAVVTGSRADYGLLRPTIAALSSDPRFELALMVTAMHLDPVHGLTVREVEADGHRFVRVPIPAEQEIPGDVGRRLGHATLAFTEALAADPPDLLLVLGDRFEILAASLAATGLELPIAHLHGGELSEGSLDDATRHCVTKLAHLHFVATRAYGERVCQLGEEPWRVHVVGAAAIESIRSLPLVGRDELAEALELEALPSPLLAFTLHSTSLGPERAGEEARAVVAGVEDALNGGGTVIVTLPNDDPGSEQTRTEMLRWAEASETVHAYRSLGQLRYLSLLRNADAVVGNSSSALIEAPSFHVPVVNVGDRQRGRLLAANVVSCAATRQDVADALRRALTPEFRRSLAQVPSPYGEGDVSRRILEVLAAAPDGRALRNKRFVDLPDGPWRESLGLS